MSTFNYRTLRKQDDLGSFYFEVHEVYYNPDGTVSLWTINPKVAFGSTKEELKESLERMLACLEAPLLEEFEDTLREVKNETKK
jgi:hypothetical protein